MRPLVKPPYLDFDPTTRRLQLDPHEPRFYQNPYEAYAWLHSVDSIFFWEEFGFWCFGGFDDVNRLLRDRRFGRQKPEGAADNQGVRGDRSHLGNFDRIDANSMLELEPPLHTRLRTLVNRAFVSRQVERLRPRIQALAHSLIDRFPVGQRVDLMPVYATPLPISVIAEMLGVPIEYGPQLLDWSHRMVALYSHGRTRETELNADAAARAFYDFLLDFVAERRRRPGDDLLSLLIAAQDGDRKLSEGELISSTILLLNAGHEATVHQTGNAVRSILAQGGEPRRFFADADATAATVEECLRFDTPLHMFTRYAYEQMEVAEGVTVKPTEQIAMLLGMANHDPRAFDVPGSFRPNRASQKNVSFGAGIHFCIGAPLARLELQVSLKTLFDRLPGIAAVEPSQFADTYHFHGLGKLNVEAG
jgi:cytochrome P450